LRGSCSRTGIFGSRDVARVRQVRTRGPMVDRGAPVPKNHEAMGTASTERGGKDPQSEGPTIPANRENSNINSPDANEKRKEKKLA